MRAILNLREEDRFGMQIKRFLQEKTGRTVSYGAMYEALSRLEKRGYVKSWPEEGGPERGNQPKRFYKVEGAGVYALQEAERVREQMPIGLPPIARPTFTGFLGLLSQRRTA